MDQQFESDVVHDSMAESPTVSADEAFEEESYGDGFEEEGMEDNDLMDDMDQYDEDAEAYDDEAYSGEEGFDESFEEAVEDEFVGEKMDAMAAMEEAVADALDAEDSDEFIRRLISGIRGVAGAVRQGAGMAGRVAGRSQRKCGSGWQGCTRRSRRGGFSGRRWRATWTESRQTQCWIGQVGSHGQGFVATAITDAPATRRSRSKREGYV